MPDKPTWCGHLEEIACHLRSLPDPWVDRAILEELLGIGPRRAQQILAPCVSRQIGANGLADRETIITHLQRLANADTVHYEHQRRQRLSAYLDALHQERRNAVLVAAPTTLINQEFGDLPEGVALSPGRISITFGNPIEALEKLLALAMAIRNNEELFEQLTTPPE